MCVFCDIISNKEPSYAVYESGNLKVVLDIDPLSEGHLLILPKIHKDSIEDIPLDILSEIMLISQKIVKAIKKIYNCDGYAIVQNGGMFCEFNHLHFHIIPRFNNDGIKWIAANREKVEFSIDVANKIKKEL